MDLAEAIAVFVTGVFALAVIDGLVVVGERKKPWGTPLKPAWAVPERADLT